MAAEGVLAKYFQILGPLRVSDDAEREIAIGGDKPAALLAMLVLRANEVIPSDRLIDDLWSGQAPPTAAKTLQVHISRLRRALGGTQSGDDEAIATSRGGYVLHADPEQVDATRCQRLVAEGRAALLAGAHAEASTQLRAALGLWRGDTLVDFAYASFAQDAIARLDGLRNAALEGAVEAELVLGRHDELIPELKALVRRDPLSERFRGQLMLALYRGGRQAEALGVYRAGYRLHVDQLGLEPGAELRDLERAILAQDPELAPPPPQAPRRERTAGSRRDALVGYERELGALEDQLEQALAGQGGVALISGEPGVGKTRLADELSRLARARGAQVLWGRCSTGAGAPGYWPWIQVLRALVANLDPARARAAIGPNGADLLQLLPELGDLVPEVSAVERSDAEDARFHLLDVAGTFLTRAAAAQPIVIVLDDLHAADRSTLALLQFLAAGTLDAPILIVGTFRDLPIGLERPLSDTLSELTRTADCVQLVLTGLSSEYTAQLVEQGTGDEAVPRLAGAIYEVTAGNPLFVRELVRLLRTEDRLHELDGAGVLVFPRGVDQVIARRIEHLSEACRSTLALAAVIGRQFDVTLLERVGEATTDELLEEIDDAVAARVVEAAPDGAPGFRFTHELVRQSLYGGLSPVERRRMHCAVALALDELHGSRPATMVADLAHHFSEALPLGDPAKAVHYLTLAGDRAAELSAYHEAAAHFERAANIGNAAGLDPGARCELHVRLAEQLVVIQDLQRAKQAIEEAGALAATVPDPSREARLAIARIHVRLLDASANDEGEIHDAIHLFADLGDPVSEARAWAALVTVKRESCAALGEVQAAERMLECAKRGGSKALIAQATRALASALNVGPVPVSEALRRMRALMVDADDMTTRARIQIYVAATEAVTGRFDEARSLMAEALALVPRADQAGFKDMALANAATLELRAGNALRAEEVARELCGSLQSQGLVRYLSSERTRLADALIAQGRLDEARTEVEQAAAVTAPGDIDALFHQARSRARLAFALGDLEAAEEFARTACAYLDDADIPDERAESLLVLASILRVAAREDEARDAALQALMISEARENQVTAEHAREFLSTPTARPAHSR